MNLNQHLYSTFILIKLEFVRCTVHLSEFAQSGDPGIKAEGGMKAEGGVKAEADAAISRVLLQSLSIPVTMRFELLYIHIFKYRGIILTTNTPSPDF